MTITRRQFLAGCAALGAGALAYGLRYSRDSPTVPAENTNGSIDDFAFLDATLDATGTVIPYGPENPAKFTQETTNEIVNQLAVNNVVKSQWYARGGKQDTNIKLSNTRERWSYILEKNERWVTSYVQYCQRALDYVWEKAKTKPLLTVKKCTGGIPAAGDAYVVNALITEYMFTATLSAQGITPLNVPGRLPKDFGTHGRTLLSLQENSAGNIVLSPKQGYLFRTAGDRYSLLQTPFAEGLHEIVSEATRKRVEAEIVRIGNNPQELEKMLHAVRVIDESVVHALSHHLLADFAAQNNISVSRAEREQKIAHEASLPQYKWVRNAMGLVAPEGMGLVQRYNSDPCSVERDLFK